MRLAVGDLETLGIYLFGPRWQTALAHAIGRSDRQVRRWVARDRPVSAQASRRIEELVRAKHGRQMRRLRANYLDMIAGLTDTGSKARLLAMDLTELRVDDQLRRASLTTPRANGAERAPLAPRISRLSRRPPPDRAAQEGPKVAEMLG